MSSAQPDSSSTSLIALHMRSSKVLHVNFPQLLFWFTHFSSHMGQSIKSIQFQNTRFIPKTIRQKWHLESERKLKALHKDYETEFKESKKNPSKQVFWVEQDEHIPHELKDPTVQAVNDHVDRERPYLVGSTLALMNYVKEEGEIRSDVSSLIQVLSDLSRIHAVYTGDELTKKLELMWTQSQTHSSEHISTSTDLPPPS